MQLERKQKQDARNRPFSSPSASPPPHVFAFISALLVPSQFVW